jgi:hypothetical protein
VLSGALGFSPYARSFAGLLFCMVTVLTAVVVALTGFSNISTIGNGRHYPRPPVIGRAVMVETQSYSPPVAKESSLAKSVAKEASPAKDVSPVVATAAKAETKKSKHCKPKVFARQRDNYGYGNALGYAQESGYGPKGLFFQ